MPVDVAHAEYRAAYPVGWKSPIQPPDAPTPQRRGLSPPSFLVLTNRTCSQHCFFCTERAPADSPAEFHPRAVLRGLKAIIAQGAQEIVLTGGEPTLNPFLPRYLSAAKRWGAERVVLETNGLRLADLEYLDLLKERGLDEVRLSINAWGDRSDDLTGDPGGFKRTLAAAENLFTREVPFEIACALTRRNAADIVALPEVFSRHFRDRYLKPSALRLHLVGRVPDGVDPHEILRYREASSWVLESAKSCIQQGWRFRLEPDWVFPLCAMPELDEYLKWVPAKPVSNPSRHRLPPCRSCPAQHVCDGPPAEYAARHGLDEFHALEEKTWGHFRWDRTGLYSEMREELLSVTVCRSMSGAEEYRVLIRTNYHCNQECDFCFVNLSLPAPPTEWIIREIDRLADRRATYLTFSGGDPTLHPKLPSLIRYARDKGVPHVEIQTNAIRCASPGFTRALKEAGLNHASVSLHGSTPAISDRVTATPGTFVQTLAGIDQLLAQNLDVILSFVICAYNYKDLPRFAGMVAARWGNRPRVNLSFVAASTSRVPVTPELIPPITAARPFIHEAVAQFREAGVTTFGLTGMCGVPLCMVEPRDLDWENAVRVAGDLFPRDFLKPPACTRCAMNPFCWGVRTRYAQLYGIGEIQPFHRAPIDLPVEIRNATAL